MSLRNFLAASLILSALGAAAGGAFAQDRSDISNIAEAFREGNFDLALRHRYEHVDEDGFVSHANASVLRTRLTFETARWHDSMLTLEVDDIRAIGADGFNSTRNGKTNYPTVADPTATELNQLFVSHATGSGLRFSLGRQRLTLSSRRYVGSINWRQNEQTFDAVLVAGDVFDGTELSYAYVSNANRIFGPKDGDPPADLDGAVHLIDAKHTLDSGTRIWGYGYFLEFDTAAALSTATVGVRIDGAVPIREALRLPFIVDVARQRDYAENPFDYKADYLLLEGGIGWRALSVLAGLEVLEGTGRTGEVFSTPLAGLHGMNGWADQFLAIPPSGLEDRYIKAGYALGRGVLDVRYHDYSASTGELSYGTELDVSFAWPLSQRYSLIVKTAGYRAEEYSVDSRKFWVMVSATF